MLRSGRQRIPSFGEREYLESLKLANLVFGDVFELLGVILTDQGIRVVIRQPEVEAADPDYPHPIKPDINAWLRKMGFEYDEGAWVREADGVVLTDEHEGNFIHTALDVYPIDLHVRRLPGASGPVIPWRGYSATP